MSMTLFRQGCDLGFVNSCTNLGVLFTTGEGVPRDIEKAIALFAGASRPGDAVGCENLAIFAATTGSPEDVRAARETLQQSCANGIQSACNNLASMYLRGKPTEADIEKAHSLLIRACDANEPSGCYNLGELLRTRLREKAEAGQIIRLFQQAYDGHIAMACRRPAEAYELGEGVPVDLDRAAALQRRGCGFGEQSACAGPRP